MAVVLKAGASGAMLHRIAAAARKLLNTRAPQRTVISEGVEPAD